MNSLLASITAHIHTAISEDAQRMSNLQQQPQQTSNANLASSSKMVRELLRIEQYAAKLRTQLVGNYRLPNLQLPTHVINDLDNNNDENKMDRRNNINNNNNMIQMRSPSAKQVRQIIDSSELVSSSVLSSNMSSSSTNADLSEDEQINYYDDEDEANEYG